MNIDKKTCINIGIVAFLLYLAIHYWDGLVGLFNLFLAAAGTLINGAIIAYVLNILMRFYERHMAPNTKKKVCFPVNGKGTSNDLDCRKAFL